MFAYVRVSIKKIDVNKQSTNEENDFQWILYQ